MSTSRILIALSLGLLISGVIVAVLKPRARVVRSFHEYHVPSSSYLLVLVAPSASTSTVRINVRSNNPIYVMALSIRLELLVKGAAGVLAGSLQYAGSNAVLLDRGLVEKLLGSGGVRILREGGSGTYVFSRINSPIVLLITPRSSGGADVYVDSMRYNLLISIMDEKRIGIMASVLAFMGMLLELRRH